MVHPGNNQSAASSDADASELQAAKAYIAELESECADLTKALTGLTCGGSEFFIRKRGRYTADIDACVEYVQRIKRSQWRRIVELTLAGRPTAEGKPGDAVPGMNPTPTQDIEAALAARKLEQP